MLIGGQEFQTTCPAVCPGKLDPAGQGSICHRCPILNCIPDSSGFILLAAEDYRPDWAKEWRRWFDSGMIGYPYLPIVIN